LSNGTIETVAKAARVIHGAANQLERVRADAKSDASIDCDYLDETVGMRDSLGSASAGTGS
jgi:hypothetical protein